MTINPYSKVEINISKALIKYGRIINLHQKVDPTTDPITKITTYNTIVTPIYGIVKDFSVVFSSIGNVLAGDKNIRISGSTGRPNIGDELDFDGSLYKIIDVKVMSPSYLPLFYDVHVRAFSVTEDPSAYVVTVGDLKTGTIVKDPFVLPSSPTWKVIAHNHHEVGITTLTTEKIATYMSFDGTDFDPSYSPSTPWNYSYMYEYLHTDFMTLFLSAEIQSILQVAQIETQGKQSNDKISLMSKEELFGTYVVASSGAQIPYWDSDARRICLSSIGENVLYWTRDCISGTAPDFLISCVGVDGKTTSSWDYAIRGVRPIIYIDNKQKVVLNKNGIYEFKY